MNPYSKYHSRWEVSFDNQLQHVVIRKPKPKALYILTLFITILGILVSAIGLFSNAGEGPGHFTNQYGDQIKLYGKGIYAADSFFRAPIFRGTDLGMLVLAIPLLVVSLIRDVKNTTLVSRMMLVSSLFVMLYYSASLAFGVHYNALHLVYILFFSASLFGFIIGMMNLDADDLETKIEGSLKLKGIHVFLIVTGALLSLAWLPEIITSLFSARPFAMIENYTTEITHVLDLGFIAPAIFLCYYFIRQEKPIGYAMLDILLTLCIIIGFVLPVQTAFQLSRDIQLPMAVIISKVGVFSILALFAVYFKIRLMAALNAGKETYI